jgi:hypothetical protein
MAGFHSYNHGLVTPTKGMAIAFVKLTGLNSATQTVEDANSNLILSCTKGATGIYTITLNKPYPYAMIACIPAVSSASATTDMIFPRYKDNSYSNTAGTFEIHLINDDDSGAGVAVDGASTNELHLILVFSRYRNL